MSALHVVELNTMSNPTPHFRDETQRERCSKCGNLFLLGDTFYDPEVASITAKHMELCEGDAAVTLLRIDQAFKAGWRPDAPRRRYVTPSHLLIVPQSVLLAMEASIGGMFADAGEIHRQYVKGRLSKPVHYDGRSTLRR